MQLKNLNVSRKDVEKDIEIQEKKNNCFSKDQVLLCYIAGM